MQSVDVLRLHAGYSALCRSLALSLREFRFTGLIRISYPRLPKWQPGWRGGSAGTLHVKLDKSVPLHAFDEGRVHTYYMYILHSDRMMVSLSDRRS